MKRRMPRRQSPFASLVPPPTEWPSAALRPSLHQPIAIAEPRFPPVLVARESRAIAAGAEPKFHFLGRAQRQPLRAADIFPIWRHPLDPLAASSTPSDARPGGRPPN